MLCLFISPYQVHKIYHIFLIALFILISLSTCQRKDTFNMRKKVNINGDIITCEGCNLFGHQIELEGNVMVIAEIQVLYIFERQAGIWNLVQDIKYINSSGIQDIVLLPSLLAVGVANSQGVGKVELFEKNNNGLWSKFQELSAGLHEDNFGNSLHISADRMIIGANAPYIDNLQTSTNRDKGRAYIYRLSNNEWLLESELHSVSSQADDRFGTAVCLIGDYALVNNIKDEPIQVFKQDESQWVFDQFLQTSDSIIIKGMVMASFENKLIVIPELSTIDSVIALSLEDNDQFSKGIIDMAQSRELLGYFGEAIEIHKGYALIAAEYENTCFLFRLEGSNWIFEDSYENINSERVGIPGTAISEQFIAYGRNNIVNLFVR